MYMYQSYVWLILGPARPKSRDSGLGQHLAKDCASKVGKLTLGFNVLACADCIGITERFMEHILLHHLIEGSWCLPLASGECAKNGDTSEQEKGTRMETRFDSIGMVEEKMLIVHH